MRPNIFVIFLVFLFPSSVLHSFELQTIEAKMCPKEMAEIDNGEACIFIQDWGSYAKGVKRTGCILRTKFPSSERPVDNFIGKWTYEYNHKSNIWQERKYAKEEGYYQHDSQVGEWLTYDSDGVVIKREFFNSTEGIPMYECVLID